MYNKQNKNVKQFFIKDILLIFICKKYVVCYYIIMTHLKKIPKLKNIIATISRI